ncbi:MAG: hypothetical protein KJ941_11135 [Bacteroidetes bacterium]|nr:hypothetical protein [Bacteroidota bacterium]
MKKALFICWLALTSGLFAQSSVIEYDFSNETYSFYKVKKSGKTISLNKPIHYSGVPTRLIINNINTNFYTVDFEVESYDEKPINSDLGMAGLMESFNLGTSSFNSLITEVKSNDIYKSLWVDGEFQGIDGLKKALGAGQTEFYQKLEILNLKLEAIEETQNKIKKASQNLKATIEKIQLVEFVDQQLLKLQMNPKMSPKEIQDRSKELVEKVLFDKVTLEGVIMYSNETKDAFSNNYNAFKSNYSALVLQQEDALNFIGSFMGSLTEESFRQIIGGVKSEILTEAEATNINAESLEEINGFYSSTKIRANYVSVFDRFDDIIHTNYSITYAVNGDKDLTVVKMQFKTIAEQDSSENEVLRTREITIPTNGGLRINSSAGMAFTTFKDGQYAFTSEEGVVDRTETDAFVPAVATMFHFYKQSPRPVNFGGTFGVSIPITGEKDFQYLLGASAIVGKSQRVILNIGAFGGKNQKLSGMEVGDSIAKGSIVPTAGFFDFGFFGGISLNIGQLF